MSERESAAEYVARLDRATAHLQPPFAVVDVDRFDANGHDIVRRTNGKPVRIATKSLRARELITRAATLVGSHRVMAFSLAEAIWLAQQGQPDTLMGYPSTDRQALALLADPIVAARVTLMVDDVAHLDLIDAVLGRSRPPTNICIDVDAAWRPLGLHVGARRSPLRAAHAIAALAARARDRGCYRVRGIMTYESQIAGLQDSSAAIRWMKGRSGPVIAERRAKVLEALRSFDIDLVNAGGTGSLALSSSYADVTEVTAGSGFYSPGLFDGYRGFAARPAALFVLPVVRRPADGFVTAFGGGYVASGSVGADRQPRVFAPEKLHLTRSEGAGEVQTPLSGSGARALRIGDRVWMRHAKAGELCERFNELHLISGSTVVGVVPTYRGEGKAFG